MLCTTEDPVGSEAEGVLSEKVVPPPPLRGEWPSALLCADKPAVVATDAIIPRRPPTLGGEFKVLDNIYIIANFNLLCSLKIGFTSEKLK